MENITEFPRSLEALEKLTNDLRCSKCLKGSEKLFSMGVCEHMLCRLCCESNLGEDCPVCGLPTHVKDAQCNRQLSNMVKLCEELKGLLTGTLSVEEDGLEEGEMLPSSDRKIRNPFSVYNHTRTPTKSNVKRKLNKELGENDLEPGESLHKPASDSTEKLSPSKTPDKMRQTTMTQLFGDDDSGMSFLEPMEGRQSSTQKGQKSQSRPATRRRTPKGRITKQRTPARKSLTSVTPTQGRPSTGTFPVVSPVATLPVVSPLPSPSTSTQSSKKKKNKHLKRNDKGETALHVAVIKGDTQKVKELLEDGATPNTRDHAGWTPLHEACNHGYREIAELLLNNGSWIDFPGMENDTPLYDAVSNNHIDCVRLLVSRGASQTLRNIFGKTVRDLVTSDAVWEALATDVIDKDHSYSSPSKQTEIKREPCDSSQFSQPVVLLATGLTREQKILLQKAAPILKGKVVEEFVPQVTHVITKTNSDGQCPRTIKYLQAILTGKWVVSLDWIQACLDYQESVAPVPEDPFEVTGSTQNAETFAPYNGRCLENKQYPRLFDGCKFYFSGSFEPPTPDLCDLINLVRCGGGTILSREPKPHNFDKSTQTVPYHAAAKSSLANCGVFIVHDNKAQFEPIKTEYMRSVRVSWIMDSVGSFKLLDPDNPELKQPSS